MTAKRKPLTLGDLGERRVISEILRTRYATVEAFGDDCAVLYAPPKGARLVATTDPCPEPMAAILGYRDLYYRGWLLATINLSDLAAAGANPLGLLTSLVLPPQLTLADFARLLDGIDDACGACSTSVVGGNLKEADRIDLTATAIGSVSGRPHSRRGARPGDVLGVVGELGHFWAGTLDQMRGLAVDADGELLRTVLTPRAKTAAAAALRSTNAVTASMDNSDGLASAFGTLAEANGVAIELHLHDEGLPDSVREVASQIGVDAMRLVFGWGDWHLVLCLDPERVDTARKAVEASGDKLHVIGVVRDGPPTVRANYKGVAGVLNVPDSERFVSDSWFTSGIDGYIERLLGYPFLV